MKVPAIVALRGLTNWGRSFVANRVEIANILYAWQNMPIEDKRSAVELAAEVERWASEFPSLSVKRSRCTGRVAGYISEVHAEFLGLNFNGDKNLESVLRAAVTAYAARSYGKGNWSDQELRTLWLPMTSHDNSVAKKLIETLIQDFR